LLRDSDINNMIEIRPVAGQPGQMQVLFVPKEPRHIKLVKSARGYMAHVKPDIRDSARAHAGDVFEPGSAKFGVLLALLGT
jgi:hypothetical protein